jgi:hypothetical protein
MALRPCQSLYKRDSRPRVAHGVGRFCLTYMPQLQMKSAKAAFSFAGLAHPARLVSEHWKYHLGILHTGLRDVWACQIENARYAASSADVVRTRFDAVSVLHLLQILPQRAFTPYMERPSPAPSLTLGKWWLSSR